MPSCLFRRCTNYTATVNEKNDVSFHFSYGHQHERDVYTYYVWERQRRQEYEARRPSNRDRGRLPRDELMREKWIKIIRIQRRENDWMATPYTTICSKHFLTKDLYVTTRNVRRLKKLAVPVIEHEENRNLSSPTTSLDQVNISDEDSIFDTPRQAYLKSKFLKVCHAKQKLQMKNNNLVRKNKRLQNKCDNLKKIVLRLRKQNYFTVEQSNLINK